MQLEKQVAGQSCSNHQTCIHQHYQKCRKQRERSIAYTLFPNEQINVLSNVHKKCTNQYCYNFHTLAYQKFAMGKQPQTEVDRNFIKNFYLQNVPQEMQMTNQIVRQLQNETFPFNAYNLAQNATKQYKAFEFKRQQYLITAQRRAKNNTKAFFKNLNEQKNHQHAQNSKWIRKIIMAVQEMGQNMFGLVTFGKQNKDTSNNEGAQRIFLNQKKHVDQKYLSSCKLTDIKTSKEILQDIRAQMLKSKKKFQQQRNNNRNNTFSASMISQSSSNNNKVSNQQRSMISNVSQAQIQESESQLIQKLCDFQQLKKKWKAQDVENVKNMIVRFLTKKIILNCEQEKYKQQRHARKADPKKVSPRKARKQYFSQTKISENSKKNTTSERAKKFQSLSKTISTLQSKPIFKQKLTKEQQQKKSAILQGGQFDVMGIKYERNRNYSDLFKKKGQNMNLSLDFIPQQKSIQSNIKLSNNQKNKKVMFVDKNFQQKIQNNSQLQQKQLLLSTARDTKRQKSTDRASSLPKGSKTERTRCL